MSTEIKGMKELIVTLNKLEKIPQRFITKAARKGILVAKKASKKGGWIDQTGNLRKAIKERPEKTRTRGKKVYQLGLDPSYNDVFQRKVKNPTNKKNGGTGNATGYYPASQEFGFRTKDGGWVPGFNYLKEGLTKNNVQIEKVMVQTIAQEIDKI